MDYIKFEKKLRKLLSLVDESTKYMRWFIGKLKIILYWKDKKIFYKWDVIKLNLWYNIWSEINKERIAIILSPNFLNKTSWNMIILPLTSYKKMKKLGKDIHYILEEYDFMEKSVVLISNIRDISKKRIIKKIWKLNKDDIDNINDKMTSLFKK